MDFSLAALIEELPETALALSRRFYATQSATSGPQSAADARAIRAKQQVSELDSEASSVTVQAGERTVPVRILTPHAAPVGVVLDIHGGGFYSDSAAHNDERNRALVDALGVAVVSVDYRLAPEHPWPAAVDDCETAALWLLSTATERFGTERVVVRGSSAGATLAMTTLIRIRDHGAPVDVVGAVLECGIYDLSATTPAGRRIADEYFLSAYLADVADRTRSDISPVFADLSNLPPTLMVVGADDPLLEDNLAMAARICSAGNDIDVRVYPESPPGFLDHPTPVAELAASGICAWVDEAVAEPPAPPWDDAGLRAVRIAIHTDPGLLVDLLSDRSVHDIAQLIGDAVIQLVGTDAAGAGALARRLARTLGARRWAGDDELLAALNAALGAGPALALKPARADLEELGDALEDGRGSGGSLNPETGDIWAGDVEDWYSSDELEEMGWEDDEGQSIAIDSLGSHESYHDMEMFIDNLHDEELAAALTRAISGRRAFRHFKDVLNDYPTERFAYYLLTNERKLGRARQWLADCGYTLAVAPIDPSTSAE